MQILATEMFKIPKNFPVTLMRGLFHQKVNHYNLQNLYQFSILYTNSVFNGQGSISYLSLLIWQLVPSEFKDVHTFSAFKAAIKNWKPKNCSCRICKTYVGNVGFT